MYKDNKKNIKRIQSIIAQRISNIQQILATMKANKCLTSAEHKMIDNDDILCKEQQTLAKKLNGKINKSEKEIQDKIDNYNSGSHNPIIITPSSTYVTMAPLPKFTPITATPPASSVPAYTEKDCERDFTSCVNAGVQNASQYAASSAYEMYISASIKSCKKQYKCSSYPNPSNWP